MAVSFEKHYTNVLIGPVKTRKKLVYPVLRNRGNKAEGQSPPTNVCYLYRNNITEAEDFPT